MDTAFIPREIDASSIVEMDDGFIVRVGDTLHTFNSTGREIVELFDGVRSIGDVIDEMVSRYPDDEQVEPAVEAFFDELERLNILQPSE